MIRNFRLWLSHRLLDACILVCPDEFLSSLGLHNAIEFKMDTLQRRRIYECEAQS